MNFCFDKFTIEPRNQKCGTNNPVLEIHFLVRSSIKYNLIHILRQATTPLKNLDTNENFVITLKNVHKQ